MPSIYDARVAAIVDPYEIVLNKGASQGVELGDRYVVFTLGDEIFDPETRRQLGRLEIVRGIGEVTHLQENMCTIESRKSRTAVEKKGLSLASVSLGAYISGGGIGATLAPWSEPEIGDFARKV